MFFFRVKCTLNINKRKYEEFSSDDGTIIFNVTDFNNEEIKLEVRANSCADNKIVYQFLDDIPTDDGNGEGSALFDLEPFKSKTKNSTIYILYITIIVL